MNGLINLVPTGFPQLLFSPNIFEELNLRSVVGSQRRFIHPCNYYCFSKKIFN